MKIKILLAVGAVVVLLGASYVVCPWLWDFNRDKAHLARVTDQMTKSEIEAIFGRPADQVRPLSNGHIYVSWLGKEWGEDTEAVFVFDGNGRILHKAWIGPPPKKGFFDEGIGWDIWDRLIGGKVRE